VVSATDPHGFLDRNRYFLNYPHEAEWIPFQIHYFPANLIVPGIEPEHLDL
jgi:hypothetical protein